MSQSTLLLFKTAYSLTRQDLDEIVQKILSYSGNKELFQRKQREAIDYCLKHFSHHVIYKQFRQLVLECVRQKRTRRKRVSRAPSIKPRSSKARLRKQVTRGRPMRRKKRRTR